MSTDPAADTSTTNVAPELWREIDRLRAALKEIERLSPKPGGVGQIARDALRVSK